MSLNRPQTTCWTLIQGAAAGHREDRDEFARLYSPAVRAYLSARWKDSPFIHGLDDAVQEVFVDCFQAGGALDRVDAERPGGFRAFLYGVVRVVALRFERQVNARREHLPPAGLDPENIEADDPRLSRVFDRTWAEAVMQETAARLARRARDEGGAALRRVELLHLRFYENRPIREIARLWDVDAAELHREYARARESFRATLHEVVAFHHPGTRAAVEAECEQLLAMLQ